MNGVFIEGMDVPRSCSECYIREKNSCPLLKTYVSDWGKPLECPITEVEPSVQPEQIVAKQILWMEIKEKPSFRSYTPHCKCSNCGHELALENINYCYVCGARFVGKEKKDG